MCVFSGGERFREYQVSVAVVCDHDVSITTARMYWEAACVISV